MTNEFSFFQNLRGLQIYPLYEGKLMSYICYLGLCILSIHIYFFVSCLVLVEVDLIGPVLHRDVLYGVHIQSSVRWMLPTVMLQMILQVIPMNILALCFYSLKLRSNSLG